MQPAVADVKGDVKMSIVCEGVDPVFLKETVKLLNEILKDTNKLEQIRHDLEKAGKRTDEIEQRLADRKLTDAQVRAIADVLKTFAGQEFQITTFWDLKEPLAIANHVYSALNLAGWKYIKPESAEFLLGGIAGVLVYVHPAADERTKKAADAVVFALINEGIDSELRKQNAPNSPNSKLHINVGTKP
jgi:multidrug efflux pump subunit AcrB